MEYFDVSSVARGIILKRKKLLCVVNVDWFFLSHRLPVFAEAIKNNYEVHIATTITDKLTVLQNSGFIVHPLNIHRSRTGLFSVFFEFIQILSVIRTISPDIVHLVTIKPVLLGGIAARLVGVSSVVSAVSGLGFVFVSDGKMAFFRRKVVTFLYRYAFNHKNQRIIFQNKEDLSELIKLTGVSKNKTILIRGSGVDLTLFKNLPRDDGLRIVMLASRLLIDKGVVEFVDAAKLVNKKFKKGRFVLVGEPDLLNPAAIKNEQINQWAQREIIENWGYRKDMHNVLVMAEIVVLPSYREGFPKVLMEASASGCAVVTTDVPGCRDVIKDGFTGLLVPPRNVEKLAAAISMLLDDTPRRKEMGANSRERAEKLFDVKDVVSTHIAIYEDLLSKNI